MPNTVHFDTGQVLDTFLSVFWKNGYKATTTKQLARSAGISESSLFNSFNSKREIYLRILRRYNENSLLKRKKMETEKSALTGIQNYWHALADNAKNTTRTKGCLITNATVELIDDPQINRYLKKIHRDYDKAFKKTLDRAVKQGELRSDTDTAALAQYFSHSAQGFRVLSKINPDRKKIDNILNITLNTLSQYQS